MLNFITLLAGSYQPGQKFGFTMGLSNTGTVALSGLEVTAVVQRPDGQVVSNQAAVSGIGLAVGGSIVLNATQVYTIPADGPSGTYTFYVTLRRPSPLKNSDRYTKVSVPKFALAMASTRHHSDDLDCQ